MSSKSREHMDAEVVLRSANPDINANEPVRAEGIGKRGASPEALEKVLTTLKGLGFEVLAHSANSISISGTSELFKRVFKVSDTNDQDESLSPPEEIREQVEGIFIQRPPKYFDT